MNDGKPLFLFLAGIATIILAGAAFAYVVRTTSTADECLKAKGMLLTTKVGTTCMIKETYLELTK